MESCLVWFGDKMKAIILSLKKDADKYRSYSAMLLDSNKTITLNILKAKVKKELKKSDIVEVKKDGNFYNHIEKQKVKIKKADDFKDGQDYANENEVKQELYLCFDKAMDRFRTRNIDENNIENDVLSMYKILQKVKKKIISGLKGE